LSFPRVSSNSLESYAFGTTVKLLLVRLEDASCTGHVQRVCIFKKIFCFFTDRIFRFAPMKFTPESLRAEVGCAAYSLGSTISSRQRLLEKVSITSCRRTWSSYFRFRMLVRTLPPLRFPGAFPLWEFSDRTRYFAFPHDAAFPPRIFHAATRRESFRE